MRIPFKVGDIVKGAPNAPYIYTNENSRLLVTDVGKAGLRVRILQQSEYPNQIGRTWDVHPDYMVLISNHNANHNAVLEKIAIMEKRFNQRKQSCGK